METDSRLSSQADRQPARPDSCQCRQIAAIDVAHVPAAAAATGGGVTSGVTGDKLVISATRNATLRSRKRLHIENDQRQFFIYTFIRHEDRLEYNKDPNKQTYRQTNKQTLQLIPQHHTNAHSIKERKIT